MKVAPQLKRYNESELVRLIKGGLAYVDGDTIVPFVAGATALPAVNNAETQVSGTTVTTANSGGTDATAFDNVTIGGLATLTYDNAHAAHGTNGFKYTIGTTNQATYRAWTGLGGVTEIWGAYYLYETAHPTSTIRMISFWGGGVLLGNLGAPNNTGFLQWKFPGDTSVGTLNNTALALNQWNRIEFHVVFNATTGSGDAQWYAGDATGQTGTSSTFSAANTGAACDEVRIGMNAASTTVSYTWWMDDDNLNATGYPGPAPYTLGPPPPVLTTYGKVRMRGRSYAH
jgi:hypothetical protein